VGFCYPKALQSRPSQSRCQSLSSSAALRPWPACICGFMSPRLLAGPIKNSMSYSLARWLGGNSSLRRHKLNWRECRRRTSRLRRHKVNIMCSNEYTVVRDWHLLVQEYDLLVYYFNQRESSMKSKKRYYPFR
jgi:hypothetical protein